jgi:hypothetical protein
MTVNLLVVGGYEVNAFRIRPFGFGFTLLSVISSRE